MKSVIMLDIDGVLNSKISNFAFSKHRLNPISVGLLNKLVELTDADVVISSNWRLNRDLSFIKLQLNFNSGREVAKRIIGVTGQGETRYDEIQEWLIKNDRFKYLVIDDNSLGNTVSEKIYDLYYNWVQPNPMVGFQFPDFVKALELLAPDHKELETYQGWLLGLEI